MRPGQGAGNAALAAAFRSALVHQGLVALLILAAAVAGWLTFRARRKPQPPTAGPRPGHAGRLLLVAGFGNLWLFDGFLQAQPAMPGGLPSGVIKPAAAGSAGWARQLAGWGAAVWSSHPVAAACAAVWIEIGLGLWLLAARHGALSRLAGLASAGWALLVWVFGESFGQLLAPGLSWLTGAPGAALLYAAAGCLIALPDRAWRAGRLGRLTLAGLGCLLAGLAALQAWPGRGFWQGISHGRLGNLAAMTQTMALTPQPRFLSGWLSAFTALDEAHGFAVNLATVAALAVTAAAFLTGRPRLIRPVLTGFALLCLADWVLVQDLGFLGGLGTDPNSMIPFVLLSASGYLALTGGQARPQAGASAYVDELTAVSLC